MTATRHKTSTEAQSEYTKGPQRDAKHAKQTQRDTK